MNLSAPFIRRPIATLLIALAISIVGMVAFVQLPIAVLPRVEYPALTVSAILPGASAETMAALVAAPLERRFGRIAGITEMTSASALGQTTVTLQFELTRSLDAAARDVQAAIVATVPELPPTMPYRPRIAKFNPADPPVLVLALSSETLPIEQLYEAASRVLTQKIAQVPGVGFTSVGGGTLPAVRVQVDADRLAGLGLDLSDVRRTLMQATANQPKGSLTGSEDGPAHTLAANDQILRAADYAPLILTHKDGVPVRLRDVANVFTDGENRYAEGWSGPQRALAFNIRRQPDANVIEVIDAVKKILPQLVQSVSPAMKVEIAIDRSQTIRASVYEVELALLVSLVLVVAVVFLFLRSARMTLITGVAVPLSILGTFGFMHLCGYSLNNLSLMALTVATGFVVDDAIVVSENIARGLEAGLRPVEAALRGAQQIAFTVVSITVSLLAVFIPLFLMDGVPGRLCREFVATLSFAVALSAVIALTLTPMMCARLLRSQDPAPEGWLARGLGRALSGMQRSYERGLRFVLRHQLPTLVLVLASIGCSVYLYIIIPKGLFPQQDTGQLIGTVEAAQDISFSALRDSQLRANQVILADPDVQHLIAFVGPGAGSAANTGLLWVALKPPEQRKASADEILNRIKQRAAKLEGVKILLQSEQDIRIGARAAKTQFQYTLQATELAELNVWAPRVLERLRGVKELRDVATDQQTAGLKLDVHIDRNAAARLGVTPTDIDEALYDAFGQRQVAVLYTESNQYRVVLEVLPAQQQAPDALNHLYVHTAGGGITALRSLVKFKTAATPLSINHQGQMPSVTLSFNLAPGVALGQAVAAIQRAEVDMGLPASVRPTFQGTAQAYSASLAAMPLLILAALAVIYIVLGILYESYVHPLTILSTTPSAGLGALLALMLAKIEFSVIALIGIILLIGIVKKNAIMMIDFALAAEREHGLTPADAIYQACAARFRPIMMTTMAALLGALPLMLGSGPGAALRRPLGIAIVGGLLVSQLVTLFSTPVVYLALSRLGRRGSAKFVAGEGEI